MSGFIKIIIIIIINDCSKPYIKDTGANFLFTREMETVREKYIRKERKKKNCVYQLPRVSLAVALNKDNY